MLSSTSLPRTTSPQPGSRKRKMRNAGLGSSVLRSFYYCAMNSVLCTCITVWCGSCTVAERKVLQRVVKSSLPTLLHITMQVEGHPQHKGLHPSRIQTVSVPPLRRAAKEH
ncbi:hypothetical protein ATANTOWER_020695 [Ataeniobius toweri]|uniref:Uncharacterized protein n=1 Tax=Ataeniobius toweri TaxID=208326 RepID=A0ABU7ARB4_9TELE|nr:hypothetical protein [Ataeniobius toweri]